MPLPGTGALFVSEVGAPTSAPLSSLEPQQPLLPIRDSWAGLAGTAGGPQCILHAARAQTATARGQLGLPFGTEGLLSYHEAEPFLQEMRGPSGEGCRHLERLGCTRCSGPAHQRGQEDGTVSLFSPRVPAGPLTRHL